MDLTKPSNDDLNCCCLFQQKSLKTDPLTESGIPEAAMLDVILPRAKSAREGIGIT